MKEIDNSKKILAQFNDSTIRVYQAYNNKIADEVVRLGTFGPSFKIERMTWIKPSFLWMMYRSGWATKKDQERILAIDIKRTGFHELLENAVLAKFKEGVYGSNEDWKSLLEISEVRCQWDPDRDIYGNPLDRRAIQLGLKGNMVKNYVNDWIVKITDITEEVRGLRESIQLQTFEASMLPSEREYPLEEGTRTILGVE